MMRFALSLGFLAALVTPAAAATFDASQVPKTDTYAWTWTGINSGVTTFTYLTADVVNTSTCNIAFAATGLRYCMNGDFITGNSGEGRFNVRLNSPSCMGTGTLQACTVRQRVTLNYDGTTSEYVGGGIALVGLRMRATTSDPWTYTLTPFGGNFSGTMSHPSPATGTWAEI